MHGAAGLGRSPAVVAPAWWNWCARTTDVWWTRQRGLAAVEAVQRQRLHELVAFARANSPFYREHYRMLPPGDVGTAALPVVGKAELLPRFDDWVTDRRVTRADVERFLADHDNVGRWYRGRYLVWTSSGSTGVPGIFLQDADAIATYDALLAAQLRAPALAMSIAWTLAASGRCAALVTATGGHYASVASWRRLAGASPLVRMRSFSILQPLPELVAALNACRPALLASYPTMLSLLAGEQLAGRLAIAPACLWSGGECLTAAARREIERAFGCRVVNEYGASECMSMAVGCEAGWLHVNADWVVLEPVDADYRPTPPGQPSHSVLLTNLANRVQPVIRYDLGDSVVVNPEPCACGNPLPAIQVEGRRDDIVALLGPDGSSVRLLPLALATVVEESCGVHRFQIVQDDPRRLRLRLDAGGDSARRAAWPHAAAALSRYLGAQGLANVEIALDEGPPAPEPTSGKLKHVIVLPAALTSAGADGRRPARGPLPGSAPGGRVRRTPTPDRSDAAAHPRH